MKESLYKHDEDKANDSAWGMGEPVCVKVATTGLEGWGAWGGALGNPHFLHLSMFMLWCSNLQFLQVHATGWLALGSWPVMASLTAWATIVFKLFPLSLLL